LSFSLLSPAFYLAGIFLLLLEEFKGANFTIASVAAAGKRRMKYNKERVAQVR